MMRIVAIGECMVEMAPVATEGQFCLGYAGDTLNTAWYLRRLLRADDRIDYFTAVGNDAISEKMLGFLQQAGIGTERILRRDDKSVGLYMIQLQDGERSFCYWRSDSAARTLAADPVPLQAALGSADLAYFSGITLAILPPADRSRFLTVLRQFRSGGGIIVFDPNLRPKLWASLGEMTQAVMQAAAASDIALPWHWRSTCLDQAWRPLRDLEKLSHCACRLKRWQTFAWQLATCELLPSIPHSDLVQGSNDE